MLLLWMANALAAAAAATFNAFSISCKKKFVDEIRFLLLSARCLSAVVVVVVMVVVLWLVENRSNDKQHCS